jgi:hypothetical protein
MRGEKKKEDERRNALGTAQEKKRVTFAAVGK